MALKGQRYDVDGTVSDVEISIATYLADMRQGIGGGYIEIVFPKHRMDVVLVVDEEGLLKELPLNPMGCALYGTVLHGQPIAGPCLVFDREAFMDAMGE